MPPFLIYCITGLLLARSSASDTQEVVPSDDFSVEPEGDTSIPPLEESLKQFQYQLQAYSNDISDRLATLEKTCKENDATTTFSKGFQYRVQTEVFKNPLLNAMLKSAQGKMSAFAQIFEDDLASVISDAKEIISKRFDEKVTAIQEAMDGVRTSAEEIPSRTAMDEVVYNSLKQYSSKLPKAEDGEKGKIALPSKALYANMKSTVDDQIQMLADRLNNMSVCTDRGKQIEDSLARVMESERKFAQLKDIVTNATVTKCPVLQRSLLSNLESAVEQNKDSVVNISDILEGTKTKVLSSLDKLKDTYFPLVQLK
ncbi:uncharacterized protein LOC135207295 [Macrobrachium nipponense]|uniref:uncharacterized protein LOC135207295 n=1 Tax=Macrobrachium nipponense TaxID=159736 RepID=UPI0030C7BDFE